MPRPSDTPQPRGQRPDFPRADRNAPPFAKGRRQQTGVPDPDDAGGNVIPPSERAEKAVPQDDDDEHLDAIYNDPSLHAADGEASDINVAALQRMTMKELIDLAKDENVTETAGLKKQDLIFRILKERTKMTGLMFGEGTLEILPDGFGFLRSPDYRYLPYARTISTSRPARSAASASARERPSRDRSARQKRTSATSRCSASRRSTDRTPTSCTIRCRSMT